MMAMEWVQKGKLIAIVRGMPGDCIGDLAEALCQGGIDAIEVTFNQARPDTWNDTAQAIRMLDTRLRGQVLKGAGTVLTLEQLHMAMDAGAQYIVTPNTAPHLIRAAKAAGLCCFPGAISPTEVVMAHDAGADAVKVFPAGHMGPAYIKALRAPLSHIPLMAVGGINEENAAEYIQAGCMGVGVGGNLVNRTLIERGEWPLITALARKYRKAVDSV